MYDKFFCAFLILITIISLKFSISNTKRSKKKIRIILESLIDIKHGNGNRRILVEPYDSFAPLIYEINEIVQAYEEKLASVEQAKVFFVKHFSLKKASEFPVFSEGFSLL